jgi:branched-chain amino acid transport system substrate-binding protein
MSRLISPFLARTHRFRRSWVFGLCFSGAVLLTGCPPQQEEIDPNDSVTIGLLLPFTGSSAATATNFERAVLMAAERVNEAGGVQGKLIRVVARDTHSDVGRSRDSARELIDEGAVAVIGPESPEIADAIRGILNDAEVPLVSPLIGAGAEVELDCDFPWYRLAPSALSLGESLANDLSENGISEIAILYGSGDYNTAFRRALKEKFEGRVLGGTVIVERALDETASSYAREIEDVLQVEPDAIVLATSPQTGSVVFTEANFLGVGDARWVLSPLLKTPLFLQNINTEQAEGTFGIAPKIFDTSAEFPEAFSERWLGDSPLEGAYFYYDAVNLLTIGFGLLEDVRDFTHAELTDALVRASSSRGLSVDWDEIERGLGHLEEGTDVHYSGLTGPILLQECGNRRNGLTRSWSIEDGKIEELD